MSGDIGERIKKLYLHGFNTLSEDMKVRGKYLFADICPYLSEKYRNGNTFLIQKKSATRKQMTI